MGKGRKSAMSFVLFLLVGIVLGGFLGHYLGQLQYMDWLGYGFDFGADPPVTLQLGIINLTVGFTLRINIAGAIGMAAAVIAHRAMR